MSNSNTYRVDASDFLSDGGATVCGFIATGSTSKNLLATVSGFQPNNGSHPTSMFVKRAAQGGANGIWFRVNFVNDFANGLLWITLYQGGTPVWAPAPQPTQIAFNAEPWH